MNINHYFPHSINTRNILDYRMNDSTRHAADAVAIFGAFGTWIGWLPSIASVLSIIWLAIQIGSWIHKTFIKKDTQ